MPSSCTRRREIHAPLRANAAFGLDGSTSTAPSSDPLLQVRARVSAHAPAGEPDGDREARLRVAVAQGLGLCPWPHPPKPLGRIRVTYPVRFLKDRAALRHQPEHARSTMACVCPWARRSRESRRFFKKSHRMPAVSGTVMNSCPCPDQFTIFPEDGVTSATKISRTCGGISNH